MKSFSSFEKSDDKKDNVELNPNIKNSSQLIKHNMVNIGIDYTVAHYECTEIPNNVFSMKNQKQRHVLWSSEFNTLTLNKDLVGSVIDSFVIYNSIANWKNISSVPTDQTNYILGYSCDSSKSEQRLMYNLNFSFTGLVFLPYCYARHWCLLVLNVEEKTMMHLDPMDPDDITGDRAIRAFLKYLKECKSRKATNNLCYLNWHRKYPTADRPIQTDAINCGIFIMFYMNRLAKRKSLLKKTPFNPSAYRNKIAKNLIYSSKDAKEICLYCEKQSKNNDPNAYQICKICNRWAHLRCISRVMENNPKIKQDTLLSNHVCRLCDVLINDSRM